MKLLKVLLILICIKLLLKSLISWHSKLKWQEVIDHLLLKAKMKVLLRNGSMKLKNIFKIQKVNKKEAVLWEQRCSGKYILLEY